MLAFIALKTSFDYLDEPHIATITYEYILPISIVQLNYILFQYNKFTNIYKLGYDHSGKYTIYFDSSFLVQYEYTLKIRFHNTHKISIS